MSKYSPEVSEASKVATGADYINAIVDLTTRLAQQSSGECGEAW